MALPGLAGHLYPVTNTLIPACEADAMTRISTVRTLLRARPLVLAVMHPLLSAAEAQLQADSRRDGERVA